MLTLLAPTGTDGLIGTPIAQGFPLLRKADMVFPLIFGDLSPNCRPHVLFLAFGYPPIRPLLFIAIKEAYSPIAGPFTDTSCWLLSCCKKTRKC
jgi:hypothetical protein